MDNLDLLEHGGGALWLRHKGQLLEMPDPREIHYQILLLHLRERLAPMDYDIPIMHWDLIFERWSAAWDLPSFESARRLSYLVDHYRAAITHDLLVHAGLDLGEEWRARRWGRLIEIIDRLPGHGHFSAAVANDEEHAEMVAKAAAERGETRPGARGDSGPSLIGWSPEVAMQARILDAINNVRYAVIAAQHGKKAGDPPKPIQRPVTALEKAFRLAEHRRRRAAHEELAARVLRRKKPVKGESMG